MNLNLKILFFHFRKHLKANLFHHLIVIYNNDYLTKTAHPVNMTHQLLFQEVRFSDFNPNCLNLGKHLFNNSTRAQVRDL